MFFFIIVILSVFFSMDIYAFKYTNVQGVCIKEEIVPKFTITEGLVCQDEETISVIREDKRIAIIRLSKPVMVAQAEQEENWGYFQFPNIGRSDDGTLIVSWQMREDSHKAYGTMGRKLVPMMSKDGGLTWQPQDKSYFAPSRGYNGRMKDGRLLQIVTLPSKNINEYKVFPKAVAKSGNRYFYKIEDLPEDLRGIYLRYIGENVSPRMIHAKLNDPGALRYRIDDLFPLVWWGNIIQMADSSLVAGVYPCRYLNGRGEMTRSSVSFFCSGDEGNSWEILSKIPCNADGILDKYGDNEFDEPTFEVLEDSTFICIMRSGSYSPLYKTFSTDKGKTWSTPIPFTPNGVNPKVMLLRNGILVLVSGRPGVQLRFSIDGKGAVWTSPIEMLPISEAIKKNDAFGSSCGYANIIAANDSSFYVVYSDFMSKNSEGKNRKAIMVRKVDICRIN